MEKAMGSGLRPRGRRCGRALTRMPMALRLLVLLMALDYLSGVGVALLGKSPKSEGGALSSRAGFAGLARKAMILVIVLLAAVLDQLTGSAACTGAATMFYIVNESLSILENAVLLGVPRAAAAAAGARRGQMDVKFRKRGAPKRKAGRINPAKAA